MGYDTLMDEEDQISPKLHAVFLTMAVSIAEIAATADMCYIQNACTSDYGTDFALAVGLVSFVICVALIGLYNTVGTAFRRLEICTAVFLGMLWGFGMIVNTSASGPFPKTDNGYFATWAGLLTSWYYLYLTIQKLQTVLDREIMHQNSALGIVFISSLFEFAVAAKDCHSSESCTNERAFAVAVGVISFFFCMFQLMFVRLGAPAGIVCAKPIGLLLVVLWSAGLGSNTGSRGPFQSPCVNANGFFASWICWGASLQYCYNSVFGPLPGRAARYDFDDDEELLEDNGIHHRSTHDYGPLVDKAPPPLAHSREY